MLNYIKSECYRVVHSKEIYVVTGVLSFLTVLMNLVLFAFNNFDPDFPYGTVRYSLNQLNGTMMMLPLSGMLISASIFSEEHKSGTLKNVISFGITRSAFMTGKCIVAFLASCVSMVVILIVYIGGAYLMLPRENDEPLWILLTGSAACLPLALAGVVLAIVLFCRYQREGTVVIYWVTIFCLIPHVFFMLGLKINAFAKIASWMPWNYLRTEVVVNMSQPYDCL